MFNLQFCSNLDETVIFCPKYKIGIGRLYVCHACLNLKTLKKVYFYLYFNIYTAGISVQLSQFISRALLCKLTVFMFEAIKLHQRFILLLTVHVPRFRKIIHNYMFYQAGSLSSVHSANSHISKARWRTLRPFSFKSG